MKRVSLSCSLTLVLALTTMYVYTMQNQENESENTETHADIIKKIEDYTLLYPEKGDKNFDAQSRRLFNTYITLNLVNHVLDVLDRGTSEFFVLPEIWKNKSKQELCTVRDRLLRTINFLEQTVGNAADLHELTYTRSISIIVERDGNPLGLINGGDEDEE